MIRKTDESDTIKKIECNELNGVKMDKTEANKTAMIAALENSLGIVTTACSQVGVSRESHYRWIREDANYKESVESLTDVAIDVVESKLYELIKQGNVTSVIFYLKTKGRKRGYSEHHELEQREILRVIDWGLQPKVLFGDVDPLLEDN